MRVDHKLLLGLVVLGQFVGFIGALVGGAASRSPSLPRPPFPSPLSPLSSLSPRPSRECIRHSTEGERSEGVIPPPQGRLKLLWRGIAAPGFPVFICERE